MTRGQVLVAVMVSTIPAYLIGSDLFFRSQVATGSARTEASDRVLALASSGFMRERRTLSLVCSAKGEAKLVLKAKIPEKGFLKIGETAPETVAFRAGGETIASVEASGTVVANGFVETVATPVLTAAQLTQVGRGVAKAAEVQVTAIGRGLTLGLDAAARETDEFIAGCGGGAAPGKQTSRAGGFSRVIAHAGML